MIDFILITLVFVVLYVAYQIYDYKKGLKKAEENKAKGDIVQSNPEVLDLSKLSVMTLEDVHNCDGKKSNKVYVSIKNIVFDVSSSDSYKPDGAYGVMAGQDISVSLGKMDLTTKYLNQYGITHQPEDEIGNMNSWFSYFYQRYPVVGKIGDKKND